jgi:hypothetical protein
MIKRITWGWTRPTQGLQVLTMTVHYRDGAFGRTGDVERLTFFAEDVQAIRDAFVDAAVDMPQVEQGAHGERKG